MVGRQRAGGFLLLCVPEIDMAGPFDPANQFLSDSGRGLARELALLGCWQTVLRMYTGPAVASHEAAQIIASVNGIGVTVMEALGASADAGTAIGVLREMARQDRGEGAAVIDRRLIELLSCPTGEAGQVSLYEMDPQRGDIRELPTATDSLARTVGLGDE